MKSSSWLFSMVLIIAIGLCSAYECYAETNINYQELINNLRSGQSGFEVNNGQLSDIVQFRARVGEASVYFLDNEVIYVFTRDLDESVSEPAMPYSEMVDLYDERYKLSNKKEITIIRSEFINANPAAQAEGIDELSYCSNYIKGNDPSKWQTHVANYSGIVYYNIYEGIDIIFHYDEIDLKYDIVVSPGANISEIKIKYEGIEHLSINDSGELLIETPYGLIREHQPDIYQELNRRKVNLNGRYDLIEPGVFGFVIDDNYDNSEPLIIDPLLSYSSYIGGNLEDWGYSIDYFFGIPPSLPGIYLAGTTWSTNFPIEGLFGVYKDTIDGTCDLFVTKVDPSGTQIIFSTYIGGTGDDWGYGITVDSEGYAYLTGRTSSDDFPDSIAYDSTFGGKYDAFLVKLNPNGDNIAYSSFLGGSDYEVGHDIAIDGSNDYAYITGMTYSSDFPVTIGSYQGYWDVFVAKLSTNSNSCSYSTLLGGNYIETSYGVDVDESENAYICGWTWSEDFNVIATDNFSNFNGEQDVFIAELSPGGDVQYCALVGGESKDYGKDIAYRDDIFITGWTNSEYFPILNAYIDTLYGPCDAIAMRFSIAGDSIVYSTYLGGEAADCGYAVAVDDSGYSYITGRTESTEYPMAGLNYIDYIDGSDVILTVLDESGMSPVFSTCYGGSGNDWGYDIDLFALPIFPGTAVFLTGITSTIDLPNTNPGYYELDRYKGNNDIFLANFIVENVNLPAAIIDSIVPGTAEYGDTVRFWGSGADMNDTLDLNIIAYGWYSDIDGFLSEEASFSTAYLSIGTHNIRFSVQDTLLLWSIPADTIVVITISGNQPPLASIDDITPNPANIGDIIAFSGSGIDPDSGIIDSVEWHADLPGFPFYDESFFIPIMIPGSHQIFFRVQDDEGAWSNPVSQDLIVNRPGPEYWEMSWWYREYDGSYDLQMHDTYSCTLIVQNIGQLSQQFNFGLGMLPDFYSFGNDDLNDPDDYNLSKPCKMNGAPYTFGAQIVDNIDAGETKEYVFETRNDWDWIAQWSLGRLIPIFISSVAAAWDPASTMVTVIATALAINEFRYAPKIAECNYILFQDAQPAGPSKKDSVYVRPEKILSYWNSFGYGYVASKYTSLGYGILIANPPPSPGALASIPFFVVEAVLYVVSELCYVMAVDPDPNFRVYVDHPADPSTIAGYSQAIDSLGDGCLKYIVDESFELYSIAAAACTSYFKCTGALDSNNIEWASKHLAATHCYNKYHSEILGELSAFTNTFSFNTGIPDDEGIEEIRSKLQNEGLPPIEDSLFAIFNLDGIDNVVAAFYDRYDLNQDTNMCSSFVDLPEVMQGFSDSLIELVSDVIGKGIDGALIGDVVKVDPPGVMAGQTNTISVWVEFPALGAGLPFYIQDFYSVNVANTDEPVSILSIGVENTDLDSLFEVKMSFGMNSLVSGKNLQLIYGFAITDDLDTLPFSTGALLTVYEYPSDTCIIGCVMDADDFSLISDAIVELCIEPNCLAAEDIDTTDGNGQFNFRPASIYSDYYLKFSKAGYSDTTLSGVRAVPNETTRVCIALNSSMAGYEYFPGDANMAIGSWPPQVIGGDVTYLVNYFRGITDACLLDGFYCSADANGDCLVIGSDVTRMVAYFRGLMGIIACHYYESAWPTPGDLPAEAPPGWPNCETPPVSSKIINGSTDN